MSDYKRLTERVGKSVSVRETSTNDNKSIWNAIERLAELEDKIENGTLIERLPIKRGDSIWLIRAKRDYLDGRYRKIVWRCIDKIFLNNDNSFTISTLSVSCGGYKNRSIIKSTTFNKSWFLTKAEAEKKLAE